MDAHHLNWDGHDNYVLQQVPGHSIGPNDLTTLLRSIAETKLPSEHDG
jgi:hypothetical protein